MKKLLVLAGLILLAGFSTPAQTSNGLTFSGVTPPAAPVLTSLSGLSASGKIYTGTKMPVIGTGFTSGCVVNVDGVAQAASTFVFVSATEIDFTIPAADGTAAGASHTLTVVCTPAVLTLKTPVTMPGGQVGVAYSANLATLSGLKGGVPPYNFSLTSGSLPTPLTLSASGVVSGMPTSAGSFNFSFTVRDSSGLAIHREHRQVEVQSLSAKN